MVKYYFNMNYSNLTSIDPIIPILTKTEVEQLANGLKLLDSDAVVDQQWIQTTYDMLVFNRIITSATDKPSVAGFIAVAYQFKNSPIPAMSATQWAITRDILDDQDRPGSYF